MDIHGHPWTGSESVDPWILWILWIQFGLIWGLFTHFSARIAGVFRGFRAKFPRFFAKFAKSTKCRTKFAKFRFQNENNSYAKKCYETLFLEKQILWILWIESVIMDIHGHPWMSAAKLAMDPMDWIGKFQIHGNVTNRERAVSH